jgi:hypothetical protein
MISNRYEKNPMDAVIFDRTSKYQKQVWNVYRHIVHKFRIYLKSINKYPFHFHNDDIHGTVETTLCSMLPVSPNADAWP